MRSFCSGMIRANTVTIYAQSQLCVAQFLEIFAGHEILGVEARSGRAIALAVAG